MRNHILRMLHDAPSGHTIHCIHKFTLKKKLLPVMANHSCAHPIGNVTLNQEIVAILDDLLQSKQIQKIGAYYFLRSNYV